MKASFLYPLSYAPVGEGGHISGELFWLFLGFVCRQPPPANPFSKPLILLLNVSTSFSPKSAIRGSQKPSPGKCRKIPGNSGFPIKENSNAERGADPGNSAKFILGTLNGHFGMLLFPWRMRMAKVDMLATLRARILNKKSLRAEGTLISEPRFSTPATCDFSHAT